MPLTENLVKTVERYRQSIADSITLQLQANARMSQLETIIWKSAKGDFTYSKDVEGNWYCEAKQDGIDGKIVSHGPSDNPIDAALIVLQGLEV
jgi:hypothetical protein